MPITKQEAEQTYERTYETLFKSACDQIDRMLCAGNRTIDPKFLPVAIRAKLIAAYSAVGWKVDYIGDMRDSYYKFS